MGLRDRHQGHSAAEKLLEGVDLFPRSFTRDGEKLLIESNASLGDVSVFSLGGTAEPLLATDFDERSPSLSPNSRWLAYVSNATGRSEVYVSPFPDPEAGRWQI